MAQAFAYYYDTPDPGHTKSVSPSEVSGIAKSAARRKAAFVGYCHELVR